MIYHRTEINRQDWLTLLLVIGMVGAAAGAVATAGWAEGLPQVVLVAAFSAALGMLLARTRFPEPVALLLSSLYGLFTITAINAAALADELTWQARLIELTERLGRWFEAALTGGSSRDNLVFVIFLSVLFWYVGHNAAWHTFRLERLGRAAVPPGVVLLVNNFYYEGPLRLEAFLILYVVTFLLLAVRSHLDARLFEWRLYGSRFTRGVNTGFFRAGLMLALALLVVAWALPTADVTDIQRVQHQWREGPLAELNDALNRLFGALERHSLPTVTYFGSDTLSLGGPIELGSGVVMYVQSDPPGANRYYWRGRLYDAYDGLQWAAEGNARSRAPARAILGMPQYLGQQYLFQRLTWAAPSLSGFAYVAQEPYQLGLDTELALVLVGDDPVSISAIIPDRPLRMGDYYEALSLVSRASPSALRVAGTNYPAWVTARYLSLPTTVTQRTRDLALRIVNEAGALTPYDQALAIEGWLRRAISYNERALAPPPDSADFVDWVLFDLREGYCTYYASAMVVMLRSLGVPARFVAGFAQGEWEAVNQRYVVREGDAHTWVEVFFPGYGWVEFEPTASRALPRGESLPPTPVPPPTATPTPTEPPAIQSAEQAGDGSTPTPDPTEAAPLTSTPGLPPPAANPDEPPTPAPFWPILLALVVLGVIGLALLVPWLIEGRGLGGLSPISRAYARLFIYGRYLGVRPPSSETPYERGRRLIGAAPQAARPVAQITEWYNVERYRRAPAADAEAVEHVWQRARRALVRRLVALRLRRR